MFKNYNEFLNEADYSHPYYGLDRGEGPKAYIDYATRETRDILDKTPLVPSEIEGLSSEGVQKLTTYVRYVQSLRNDHKRSGYTEPFIRMTEWVLTGTSIPRHPFVLSQGAYWGFEFVDDLCDKGVLERVKQGRQYWLKSTLSESDQEKLKSYLEEKERKYRHDHRGAISAKTLGIVEKKK